MYAMIEAGLRGGMTQTTCKKVEANNPPTPWSPEAKGKARGEAVHGRDTKVRHELSPEVQANRGRSCVCVAEALVLVFLNGSKVG